MMPRVFVLLLIGASLCSGLDEGGDSKKNVSLIYDGDSVILLELTRKMPFQLQVWTKEAAEAQFNKKSSSSAVEDRAASESSSTATAEEAKKPVLIDVWADATSVKGARKSVGENGTSTGGEEHVMSIAFDNVNVVNNRTTLKNFNVSFIVNTMNGKWNLTAMKVSFSGSLTGSSKEFSGENYVNVMPKSGYTSNPADAVCARGYAICAPKNLCWTCYDQTLNPKIGNDSSSDYVAGLMIPGMKLQPFYGNTTTKNSNGTAKIRFGYNWDCDPVLSMGVWQGLLLSLGFAFILAWSITYLAIYANTPTRFDDPRKDKPLVVPTSD